MTRSEASIQRAFVRAVKKSGGWPLKLKGPRGWPDYTVIWPSGRCHFVELKAPGKKPRKSQVAMHAKLRSYYMFVEVIDSIDDVDAYVRCWG